MKYGPNTEQVEAYLVKIADLDADDWATLALALKDLAGPRAAASRTIETARSRAAKHGVKSEVEAAAREAQRSMDSVLDASIGSEETLALALARIVPDDPSLGTTEEDTAVAALRAAAISGAMLLVLRPLLREEEFTRAWPMRLVDPRSLPRHAYVPPIGAAG